ncbi:hypothetical protein GLOTRDRAFT_138555 [Gloeophyllum trabeum ATCC 11539]|uniref:Rhodopsin domain-containing protein n=1 Tax=Gloeophyllum trabeum (strain ATCC 11539 / FP-39264 / Madison 617) TaxID=670483 RepID=S7Q6T9_GLOTA|nr:uncharacterized protein GLOTRDRAFT_138555 [Gloeophyllum trabeum ATCC 11539]EPQ55756.1 hypothetical protein GLOTRDRAFT_138555 [Gloeophyllum trabeum ATCC 11539]
MGLNLQDPLVQIKLTQAVCGFVAIFMTVARLYIRRGRYWWDDAWAFFALINLFIQFAGIFMHVENPAQLSKTSRVAAYYLIAVTFYTIIWSARLSILFTIIRIDPDPAMRHRLKYVAGVFIFAIVFFFCQLMWVCEPPSKRAWKDVKSPQCELGSQVAICQIVTDVISDLLLMLLPLRLIRGIQSKGLRRRLMVIFSTSISLVHAAYIIAVGGTKVVLIAAIEDCLSLTVANLPVMATSLFRALGMHADGGAGDSEMDDTGEDIHFKTRSRSQAATGLRSRISGMFAGGGRTTTTTWIGKETVGRGTVGTEDTGDTREDEGAVKKVGFVAVGEKGREGLVQFAPTLRQEGSAASVPVKPGDLASET